MLWDKALLLQELRQQSVKLLVQAGNGLLFHGAGVDFVSDLADEAEELRKAHPIGVDGAVVHRVELAHHALDIAEVDLGRLDVDLGEGHQVADRLHAGAGERLLDVPVPEEALLGRVLVSLGPAAADLEELGEDAAVPREVVVDVRGVDLALSEGLALERLGGREYVLDQ